MIRLAFPGDLATATGGYVYDRKVIAASGGRMAPLPLPEIGLDPDQRALSRIEAALRAAPGPVLIDGLSYGVLPADLIAGLPRRPVALCHHPLAWEAGLAPEDAARLVTNERRALAEAAHVIVTSEETKAALIAEFGLSADSVTVAPPGLDRPAPAPARRREGPPVILTVASLTPRKGHETLLGALRLIADRPWRADWLGATDLDPAHAKRLHGLIDEAGLADRIAITGPIDAESLAARYRVADIFCLPSRYEGYGMVFAEAMAHRLPIAACDAGAVRRLVPPAAGLLTEIDDAPALAGSLNRLLDDPALRGRMGAAGLAESSRIPGWDATWAIIADVMGRAA